MSLISTEYLPFVSIIIPVKNEEKYIQNCLNSVTNVDYPKHKYEIIVVDNNSIDNTKVIVGSFKEVVLLEKNDGTIGAVRNFGAKHAKGDYLAFLDGDCIAGAQWLKIAINILLNMGNVSIVGAVIKLEEGERQKWIEEYWINYLNSKYHSDMNYVLTISSFCFVLSKKLMQEVGGFNERLVTCEDSDFGYKVTEMGAKIVIRKDIEIIHMRNAKNTLEFFRRQLWQGSSNLKNFFSHKFELNELPSIVIPLIYLFSIMSLLASFFLQALYPFRTLLIIFIFCVPVVITVKTRIGRDRKRFFVYAYLWFLYISARGLGMIFKISQWKV